MRKEMKPYRCRLNMTEFYYRPDIGSGNLSKKAKSIQQPEMVHRTDIII